MCSPKYNDDWLACPSCDQLYDLSEMQHGDQAHCSHCNASLSASRTDMFSRVQAFSLSSIILMIMSCSFPFLAFKASGLESVMTLPQAVQRLHDEGMTDLALLVGCFILLIPAVLLVLSFAVSLSLGCGWRNHWAKDCAKIIFHLKAWSMVEVFFIGVLVSYVKIVHMATVVIGISFWAYAIFTITFTMTISNLDRYQTWKRLEELER
ncbi:MAG: paraquat-inducible protein A [Lentimonas sp.]|jgi:paraquat-inducible protein A